MAGGGFRTSALVIGALVAASDARADTRHRRREIREDSVDLVARVAWNPQAPPDGHGDRDYLRAAFLQFASRTYSMTEGRLKICKVHVYYQRDVREADIRVELSGRSHAPYGGIRTGDGFIQAYTRRNDLPRPVDAFGDTLAHEFGHYGLFLMDEYRERVERNPAYTSAWPCDTTLSTTMAINSVSNLSLPTDYSNIAHPAWGLGEALDGKKLTQQQKYADCKLLTEPPADARNTENATWRTAQWRTYRKSAWEVITGGPGNVELPAESRPRTTFRAFRAIADAGMPRDGVLTKPSFDGSCHETIFYDDAVAVLLIDGSNSMKEPTSDPTVTFFDRAKNAARKYLQTAPVGTTVAIVHFASALTNVAEPTKITDDTVRNSLIARIDALPLPNGNTGLDAALNRGQELIVKNSFPDNWQYIIAITDGTVVVSDWIVGNLRTLSIPVFSLGVGGPNTGDVLGNLSRATHGAYRSLQPWEHDAILRLLPLDETVGYRFYPRPMGSEPLEEDVHVSEVEGSTAFRALWSSADKASFELVAPDGTVISPGVLPSGVTYESHTSGATYHMAKPAVGKYKTRILPMSIPTSDFSMDVASDSPLRLRVEVTGSGEYPEPWFVRATLSAGVPVVGAALKGLITGTSKAEIKLRDDGFPPDESANDGVYTGAIASLRDDGKYNLEVVAENPGGAKLDSSGVVDESDSTEPAKPISAFVRKSSHNIEAKLFREMPRSAADAIRVRNDYTAAWIAIDKPGDAVWVSFNGYRNGQYVAMTGDMVASTDQRLTTKLSLYAPDGTTLLAENAQSDGRARVHVSTPKDQDGIYFLKIEGSAPGRLRVAVAPADWFAESTPQGDGGGGGGCDCGAAGRAGSPWVLSLGLLYLARRWLTSRSGDDARNP
jgi:hypothetical protein